MKGLEQESLGMEQAKGGRPVVKSSTLDKKYSNGKESRNKAENKDKAKSQEKAESKDKAESKY